MPHFGADPFAIDVDLSRDGWNHEVVAAHDSDSPVAPRQVADARRFRLHGPILPVEVDLQLDVVARLETRDLALEPTHARRPEHELIVVTRAATANVDSVDRRDPTSLFDSGFRGRAAIFHAH